jgi:hypothetical protein
MNRFKKTLAGVATLAAVASVAPFAGVGAASALTNNGQVTLNPTSGNSATKFQLGFPGTPQCVGDTAAGGYNWSTFMLPQGSSLATTTFTPAGPNQVAGQYRASLISAAGDTVAMQSTGIAGGPGQPGIISGIPQFTFEFNLPGEIPAGAYDVGVACTTAGGSVVDTYWSRPMTVTVNTTTGGPAQISWAQGAIPAAPAITSVTPGDGTLAVAFTPPSADPAVSTYTLSATPTGGGSTITQTGTGSPITISGLTNGTAYDLALTATNTAGTSVAATSTGTPTPGLRSGVSNLTATPGIGIIDVDWDAPTDFTPTGYSVEINDGTTTNTVTVGAGVTAYQVTGAPAGVVHTFRVTPLYPAPYTAATSSPVTAAALAAQVLLQDITVTRPVGALVLTQVCGAHGALPLETAQLGFPSGLPAAPAVNSSTVATPSNGAAPTLGANGTGGADPVRSQYPYPTLPDGRANATYPTHCGIDLGNAQFVRSGAGAGQFFAADGRLNQVTVVDTRDGDTGWNVVGQVSNFTAGPGKSFSGSQLGWVPVKTEDTSSFTDSLGNTYDQVATAGGPIAPNTAVASGLSSNRTLISANGLTTVSAQNTTGGLGTAIADARLKLLIPVTAQSGTYSAVLTISTL